MTNPPVKVGLIILTLDVYISIDRIFLNKFPSWRNLITHKHREYPVCLAGIIYIHLAKFSEFRIHGGIPQLLCVHFSKTLITLYLYTTIKTFGNGIAFLIAPCILFFLALFNQVKWRCCNINVPILKQLLHITEEESKDKSFNVATIYIGITHDHNLVISKLC